MFASSPAHQSSGKGVGARPLPMSVEPVAMVASTSRGWYSVPSGKIFARSASASGAVASNGQTIAWRHIALPCSQFVTTFVYGLLTCRRGSEEDS